MRRLPTEAREATWWTLVDALDTYLRLLHPVMPFVTEALWASLPHRASDPSLLIVGPLARGGGARRGVRAGSSSRCIDLVRGIRNARSEARIEPATWLPVDVAIPPALGTTFDGLAPAIERLARARPLARRLTAEDLRPSTDGSTDLFVDAGDVQAIVRSSAAADGCRCRRPATAARLERELEEAEGRLAAVRRPAGGRVLHVEGAGRHRRRGEAPGSGARRTGRPPARPTGSLSGRGGPGSWTGPKGGHGSEDAPSRPRRRLVAPRRRLPDLPAQLRRHATATGPVTCAGIIEHLDYLGPDGLGVDAIWLSPIYPSPGKDVGYDVSDHTAIDPTVRHGGRLRRPRGGGPRGRPARHPRPGHEPHQRPAPVVHGVAGVRGGPYADWYLWRDPAGWTTRPAAAAQQLGVVLRRSGLGVGAAARAVLPPHVPRRAARAGLADAGGRGGPVRDGPGLARPRRGRVPARRLQQLPQAPGPAVEPDRGAGTSPWDRQVHVYDRDQPDFPACSRRFRAIVDARPGRMSVGELFDGTVEHGRRADRPIATSCSTGS